jgi:hypothetical protein
MSIERLRIPNLGIGYRFQIAQLCTLSAKALSAKPLLLLCATLARCCCIASL